MGRMDHPFRDIRVYTPAPLEDDVVLPPCARNVVLSSPWPLAMWEQFTLLKAHGHNNLLLCPSYVIPFFATLSHFAHSPRILRRLSQGVQLVGSEQGQSGLFTQRETGNRGYHRQRTQQEGHGALLWYQAGKGARRP